MNKTIIRKQFSINVSARKYLQFNKLIIGEDVLNKNINIVALVFNGNNDDINNVRFIVGINDPNSEEKLNINHEQNRLIRKTLHSLNIEFKEYKVIQVLNVTNKLIKYKILRALVNSGFRVKSAYNNDISSKESTQSYFIDVPKKDLENARSTIDESLGNTTKNNNIVKKQKKVRQPKQSTIKRLSWSDIKAPSDDCETAEEVEKQKQHYTKIINKYNKFKDEGNEYAASLEKQHIDEYVAMRRVGEGIMGSVFKKNKDQFSTKKTNKDKVVTKKVSKEQGESKKTDKPNVDFLGSDVEEILYTSDSYIVNEEDNV